MREDTIQIIPSPYAATEKLPANAASSVPRREKNTSETRRKPQRTKTAFWAFETRVRADPRARQRAANRALPTHSTRRDSQPIEESGVLIRAIAVRTDRAPISKPARRADPLSLGLDSEASGTMRFSKVRSFIPPQPEFFGEI